MFRLGSFHNGRFQGLKCLQHQASSSSSYRTSLRIARLHNQHLFGLLELEMF
jgi:hypothetical protein